jgi:hypothetical protein
LNLGLGLFWIWSGFGAGCCLDLGLAVVWIWFGFGLDLFGIALDLGWIKAGLWLDLVWIGAGFGRLMFRRINKKNTAKMNQVMRTAREE